MSQRNRGYAQTFWPWKESKAAGVFRKLLSNALDDLVAQVEDPFPNESVREALLDISENYRLELYEAWGGSRSDWYDPANRCAYVFLYFTQHCYLMFFALRRWLGVDRALEWQHASRPLKLCSVGGGPGSDLVGLLEFLRLSGVKAPGGLQCRVLDRCPRWRGAWDVLRDHLPPSLASWLTSRRSVRYRDCDIVGFDPVPSDVLDFAAEADLVTIMKSFSPVAAFVQADESRGNWMRDLLSNLKPGCFVIFIDNVHESTSLFREQIADPAGLYLIESSIAKPQMPQYNPSPTIQWYCEELDFEPMRSCKVVIELYEKVW